MVMCSSKPLKSRIPFDSEAIWPSGLRVSYANRGPNVLTLLKVIASKLNKKIGIWSTEKYSLSCEQLKVMATSLYGTCPNYISLNEFYWIKRKIQ
ncbi:hypothetical protein BpHYR1_038070 [Brachionus plicatilis]|uniref:Uncharacterized protein n=1 Tax=Brachionus plicatilis TaxID=10195 RepID=A0A3M7R5F0_BRAPC|nr:hypothetical protein BpHYR1_038070 [Brachionus plicatilis]